MSDMFGAFTPRPLRPHQVDALAQIKGSLGRGLKRVVWLPVLDHEGLYEVSSAGEVRGLDRLVRTVGRTGVEATRMVKGRLLKQTSDWGKHCYGRLTVGICKEGVVKTRLVHQIVAEAFYGPRPEGMQVAHCDGNPANNAVENLRYATALENTQDKVRHGTVLRGAEVGNAKLTENQVRLIRSCGLSVTDAAKAFGISIAQVSRIRSGSRWGHVQ